MMRRRTCLAALAGGVARAADTRGRGGLIWAGTLSKKIAIIDEDSEQIVGEVPLYTGIPRNLVASFDKKKIYAASPLNSAIASSATAMRC